MNPGTGPTPRAPDASLRDGTTNIQDLDSIVDASRSVKRYPSDSVGWFEKALVLSDFLFVSPSTIQVRCFLDFGDFNDDGAGFSPEVWELGIFSDHPDFTREPVNTPGAKRLMVAYGTFPKEIKDATKQIEHFVRLTF